MKKRILVLVLVLCMLMSLVPCVNAATVIASGDCGGRDLNNTIKYPVYYTLYSDGEMVIYGNGAMDSYMDDETSVPWYNYKDSIKSLTVEQGVTNVGTDTFSDCINLTDVVLSEGVETIDVGAFYGCKSLSNIKFPSTLTKIFWSAFAECANLTKLEIPVSVKSIWHTAFYNCTNLTDVYYNGSDEQWKQIAIEPGQNDCLLNANIHFNSSMPQTAPRIISAVPSKTNSTYTLNVQVNDVAADCQLVTVLYNGEKMVNVKTTDLKKGDTAKSVAVTADNATSCKVFIWNNLNAIHPLCEAKSVDL